MRLADHASSRSLRPPPGGPGGDDASGRLRRLGLPSDTALAPDLLPSGGGPESPTHEVLGGVGQWVPLTDGVDDEDDHDAGRPSPGLVGRLGEALRARLPSGPLDAGVRGVAALAGLALVAALVAVVVAWRAAPHATSMPVQRPVVELPAGGSSASSAAPGATVGAPAPSGAVGTVRPSAAAEVVVDVVGKVQRPGLVRLPPGSRVADALAAAGGARPGTDLTAVPLARRLVDGEQVAVGVPGATGTAAGTVPSGATGTGGAAPSPGATAAGPLDLNAATADQLDALPGVGPVLAQRIVAWREAHGGFASVDQLRQVSGLGGRKGEALLALVRV